jgi:hypothetical protein
MIVGHFTSPNRVVLSWFNNLPVSVSNVVITANLSGTAYDKTKVQPDLGYFNSAQDQIVWNQQTNPELAYVAAGANGTVSFTITPNILSGSSNNLTNPSIHISANVSADRTQESGVSGSLTATVSRNINVASSIGLSGRIVRSVGPFINSGPIPPRSEQKTTYTVIWTISNTTSLVDNAQVIATLPPYVTWIGSTSPSSENITYDQNTGVVTWNAGSISPNSSNSANRREVDFQIAFQPSVTQISTDPTLVNQATLTAVDDFTKASLTSMQDYLTTSYSTDPVYKSGDETVVQ